jgi:exonuclease SbcC
MDYSSFVSSTIIRQDEMDRLTSKSPTKRKEMLMNIFGLEIYEKFVDKAKELEREIDTKRQISEARQKDINKTVEKEPNIKKNLKESMKNARVLEKKQGKMDSKIKNVENKRDEYLDKKLEYEKFNAKLEPNLSQISYCKSSLTEIHNDIKESKLASRKLKKVIPAYEEYRKKLEERDKLKKVKEKFDEEQKHKDVAIKAISSEKRRLRSQITSVKIQDRKLESEMKNKKNTIKEIKNFEKTFKSDLSILDGNINKLSKEKEKKLQLLAKTGQQIKEYKSKIKEAEDNRVKIEEHKSPECPVCKRPLKKLNKEQLIEHYKMEVDSLKKAENQSLSLKKKLDNRLKVIETELKDWSKKHEELQKLRTKIGKRETLEQRVRSIQKELNRLRKDKKRIEILLSKNKYALQDRRKLKQALETIKELNFDKAGYNILEAYIKRKRGIEEQKGKLENQAKRLPNLENNLHKLKIKISGLEKEKKELKKTCRYLKVFADKYETYDKRRKFLEGQIREIGNNIASCKTQITAFNKELEEIDKLRTEFKELTKKIKKQIVEISAYRRLQEIFGKNGIPTAILTEIVPLIEIESSKILRKVSNGRLDVGFRFGSNNELIFEGMDVTGGHSVLRFSGGERMRINLSLRLGVSEIIAQRKGKGNLETLVVDEGFGHLDAEGRKAVIDIFNTLTERFNKILVISHVEDVKEAFDSKLLVENVDGYSKIRFIE